MKDCGVPRTWIERLKLAGNGLMAALAITAAVLLLYGCWCAHTNFRNCASVDYARYTNMMWNTAHGRPFFYGLFASYLQVHLSFTLGLFAFLFYLWDDAFLPALLQWVFMVLGGLCLVLAARKTRAPPAFTLALLVFWTLYPFMQSVVLCEFHGASAYLFLIPLLYLALLSGRGAWAVLLLIVGLREEAGLMAAPLLAYFAARERSRSLAFYAAAAVLYVVGAIFVLYPLINGASLLHARQQEIGVSTWMDPAHWELRWLSLFWVLLPVAPLARYWKPLAAISSLAVLTALGSSFERQMALKIHYPAAIMACVAVAMVEAWRSAPADDVRARRLFGALMPLYLVFVTLGAHYHHGFVAGARPTGSTAVYRTVNPEGRLAVEIARREIPRTGVLVPDGRLIGFVGNRADLGFAVMSDLQITPDATADVLFCRRKNLPPGLLDRLADASWGVSYYDPHYVVARRGFDPSRNRKFLGEAAP